MRPPLPGVPPAQLAELGRAVVLAVAQAAGQELGSEIVSALAERLGPDWVRGELDAWQLARAAADVAENRKFGPEPGTGR